jgi:DNA topoisomerase I
MQAFCMKCQTTRDMLDPQPVYSASGRPGTQGTCAVCGTKMFKQGLTDAHAGVAKPDAKAVKKAAGKKTKKATRRKTTARAKTASKRKSAASEAPRTRLKGERLVIVESPTKARSVGNFLGKGYVVKASKGHVRDLLVTQLSVDVENGFEPKYRVPNEKRDIVKELKAAAEGASEIYIATDPDREGEAIAWHLVAATEMDQSRIKRVVFHEITRNAIQDAFSHPRSVDMSLVNAQQARRILDRLVGYPITQLLWQKVGNGLSAGRVQSVAMRMIVDREREIEAFVPHEYWTLDARLKKQAGPDKPFMARLLKIRDQDVEFGSEGDVLPHLDVLEKSLYRVRDVKEGTRQRKPSAPFTTSTLQQEASRRLGFTARRTMSVAQQLYEGILMGDGTSLGLITYMRTDSTNVAKQAQDEARDYIKNKYGSKYVPARAPEYKTKSKTAQEAHEAIRPTAVLRHPDDLRAQLSVEQFSREQFKLYQLIWQRFVASQMENAVYNTMRVDIEAGVGKDLPYLFRVSGSTLKFNGFLAVYEETRDEDATVDEDEGRILPPLKVGETLDLIQLLPEQHFTQPPPRYTEATLIREMEEFGIGRPSTYEPTINTILNREYVERVDKRLLPTDTGKLVNDLLVAYFPNIMDYHFTAQMEDELDKVAEGDIEWQPMLDEFYAPYEEQLQHARSEMPETPLEKGLDRACPNCGNQLMLKRGRFGKFIGCSTYPECRYTEPWLERAGVACPICGGTHGGEIIIRKTRKGRTFYGCSRYPDCDFRAWKLPGKNGAGQDDAADAELLEMDDRTA